MMNNLKATLLRIGKTGSVLFCLFLFFKGTVHANNDNPIGDTTINLNVNAVKIAGMVNKKIYGDLLEHIYHSLNGGLWGEMLASRSFEPAGSKGWYLSNDEVASAGTRTSSLFFGKPSWADYELSGEVMWEPYAVAIPAPWSGGQSDVRILFRNGQDSSGYALHINVFDPAPFSLEKIHVQKNSLKTTLLKTGASTAGTIATPRQWHKFSIVCKGAAITVFIDDKEILNFTDNQNPILKGIAGLYLTKTTGRFKNLRVKSSDGRILWEGLPEEVKPSAIAPNWMIFGEGVFFLTKGQVINGNYAQKIMVNNSEAGVKQPVFNLKANENYNGSVWLHSEKGLKLFVRFQDGSKVLAEDALVNAGLNWKKYKFVLKPSLSSLKGEFVIYAKGTGSVWVDQASLMPQKDEKIGGYRPDLYKALADLNPTHLRWPGGSYASGYNWKWGIGPQKNRVRLPKSSWDDLEQNAFGTHEFLALCKKLGSEPVFVIRIGYDKPDSDRPKLIKEAQEWVEYCNGAANTTWGKIRAKNGHPLPYKVKYWEIDNEMWEMGVEKYGELLREFVPALKKIDPTIKIIACGDFTDQGKNQDSILFNTSGKYFDYISLHHYESPARYDTGPLIMEKKYKEEERRIAESGNSGIKLYISEWNASETDWRTGLYAAGTLNVFEKDTHISMAAAALLFRRNDASGWNNAFINFDVNSWFPAPNYVVTKLYREHYQPNLLEINNSISPLNAVATQSADGKKIVIKIVNPVNQSIKVNLKVLNFKIRLNTILYLIAPASLKACNTLEQPGLIAPHKISIQNTGNSCSYVLPPLSVGVFELNN